MKLWHCFRSTVSPSEVLLIIRVLTVERSWQPVRFFSRLVNFLPWNQSHCTVWHMMSWMNYLLFTQWIPTPRSASIITLYVADEVRSGRISRVWYHRHVKEIFNTKKYRKTKFPVERSQSLASVHGIQNSGHLSHWNLGWWPLVFGQPLLCHGVWKPTLMSMVLLSQKLNRISHSSDIF